MENPHLLLMQKMYKRWMRKTMSPKHRQRQWLHCTPNSADTGTSHLFVDISLTEIKKLKVAELKSELQKRGPDTKGLNGASLGRVANWCHHE
jgi:hypothetical protein